MEELDGLQQELEAALSAVVVGLKSTFACFITVIHLISGAEARVASGERRGAEY